MTLGQIILETSPFLAAFLLFAAVALCCATERCRISAYLLRAIERGFQ
jgi:hypothetical protein